MRKFVKIAWRNVWRNRRRSLITMGAMIFALMITVVTRSLQYGTYDALESYAVRLLVGEMQVQKRGFKDNQTLSYSFPAEEVPLDRLASADGVVQAYSKRITSFGLVASTATSAGAMIIGVQPDAEKRVTHFTTQIILGETLNSGDDHRVLLGHSLARNLGVAPGDTVVILTQGFHNELGADSYIVKGTIRSGNQELDRALVVMSLRDAQDLFSLWGRITQVVLRTPDFRRAPRYARRLSAALDHRDQDLVVLPWQQLIPELLQLIALDNVSGAIFLLFLLLIVGFEILNTTLMAVMERIKEFGILQALGVKPRQISLMLFLETSMKIILALIIGLILSYGIIQIIKPYPIPLSKDMHEAMASWGFVTDFYFTDRIRVFLEPLFAIGIISVLSILYPIYKSTKLRPVQALQRGK